MSISANFGTIDPSCDSVFWNGVCWIYGGYSLNPLRLSDRYPTDLKDHEDQCGLTNES